MTGALDGQVVVLTGASRGLGLLTAKTLPGQGARVIAGCRAPSEVLQQLRKEHPGRLDLVQGDVAEEDTAAALIKAAAGHGGVTALVHNAGIAIDRPLVTMAAADWDEVIRVNLRGAFLVTKHALKPMMRRKYGRVVYVSSVSAAMGSVGQANYAASKSGLHGLALTVAQEYAGYGVTAAAIAPGVLDTGLGAQMKPRWQRAKTDRSLTGLGEADKIADTIAFLAGPRADVINATVIRADGGIRYA